MSLQEKLKQIQTKIDLVIIYNEILSLKQLPIKKEIKIGEEAIKQVQNELVNFCKMRIDQIENDEQGAVDNIISYNNVFSEQEVNCLKMLCVKLLTKNEPKQVVHEPAQVRFEKPVLMSKTGKAKMVEQFSSELVLGSNITITALGGVQPTRIRSKICAYDKAQLLSIDKTTEIAKVKHLGTGDIITLPLSDIE